MATKTTPQAHGDPRVRHLGGSIYAVRSEPGKPEYRVDTAVQFCSCSHWRFRLAQFPVGDGRRSCKHLRLVGPPPPVGGGADTAVLNAKINELAGQIQQLWVEREIFRIRAERAEAGLPALDEVQMVQALEGAGFGSVVMAEGAPS